MGARRRHLKRGAKTPQSAAGLGQRLEVVLDFLGDLMDDETRRRLARRANELFVLTPERGRRTGSPVKSGSRGRRALS
jgi:hypothetical protein